MGKHGKWESEKGDTRSYSLVEIPWSKGFGGLVSPPPVAGIRRHIPDTDSLPESMSESVSLHSGWLISGHCKLQASGCKQMIVSISGYRIQLIVKARLSIVSESRSLKSASSQALTLLFLSIARSVRAQVLAWTWFISFHNDIVRSKRRHQKLTTKKSVSA